MGELPVQRLPFPPNPGFDICVSITCEHPSQRHTLMCYRDITFWHSWHLPERFSCIWKEHWEMLWNLELSQRDMFLYYTDELAHWYSETAADSSQPASLVQSEHCQLQPQTHKTSTHSHPKCHVKMTAQMCGLLKLKVMCEWVFTVSKMKSL